MVRVFASIPKVKGSKLMSGVVCDQQWYVDLNKKIIEFLK